LSLALSQQLGLRFTEALIYAGTAVSFKVSPVSRLETCYVFPLFVASKVDGIDTSWEGADGSTFRLLSKPDVDLLIATRSPNADVLNALAWLFPAGWSSLAVRSSAVSLHELAHRDEGRLRLIKDVGRNPVLQLAGAAASIAGLALAIAAWRGWL
jgi:hypothetical protein